MTFTYDPTSWPTVNGFPVPTDLARVRQTLGDTNQNDNDLEDEEILAVLGQYGADVSGTSSSDDLLWQVTLDLAEQLVGKYARQVDEGGAGITTTRSQRHQQWLDLIRTLKRKINRKGGAKPSFIGRSRSKIQAIRRDPDYIKPEVQLGEGRRTESDHDPHRGR